MSSKQVLFALGAAAVVASAGSTLALDHFGILDMSPKAELKPARRDLSSDKPAVSNLVKVSLAVELDGASALASPSDSLDLPDPAERLAYLSPQAAALLLRPSIVDDPTSPAVEPAPSAEAATGIVSGWISEIKPKGPEAPRAVRPLAEAPTTTRRSPLERVPLSDYSLKRRLAEISPAATLRLQQKFEAAKVAWPPTAMSLVAIKDEKILELYARSADGTWKFVYRYSVLAASGGMGPKLRQGDKQVPEGVYAISLLNPNSRYHVSLRVNYPNAFDREMASADGRDNLGGDIMIHGKAASMGCLAIGDEAAEEVFVLAAQIGLPNIKLIIAPTDLRRRAMPTVEASQPKWLPKLYTDVATAMAEYKAPPRSIGLLSLFGGN